MPISQDDVRDGNIYVYKLKCDNGGAPCIHEGVLSLAICKPRIRQRAQIRDWIIGLGARGTPELTHRLIYIARVTAVEENGGYYGKKTYHGRPDCIYRHIDPGYQYRQGSRYHGPEDLEHDLGAPPLFDRARTLLSASGNFVYFGGNPVPSIDEVRDIYEWLPRDYRINHAASDRNKLEGFIVSIFTQFGHGRHGEPTHGETSAKCNVSEDEVKQFPRCQA